MSWPQAFAISISVMSFFGFFGFVLWLAAKHGNRGRSGGM